MLFELLTRANGFVKLEADFRLQIFGSLYPRGRSSAFESLLQFFDFSSKIAALGPPLVAGPLELVFEIILDFFLISKPLFVLRLHLLNELLGRGFGPGNGIQIDGFVFPLELGAAHFCAFEAGGFSGLQ